ncbi:hypothetical protein QBC35DRAFT_213486 [Podospora australis]|uniref:Secreted protein n=1 Tax=Podospora australis TaxID=1536484 RepID=A0AAN7AI30_9PEZI|nr:hypothetical protein QBC35DRAFT_213486 [Podospora australis]
MALSCVWWFNFLFFLLPPPFGGSLANLGFSETPNSRSGSVLYFLSYALRISRSYHRRRQFSLTQVRCQLGMGTDLVVCRCAGKVCLLDCLLACAGPERGALFMRGASATVARS